ncbi:MAG: zf-HC2 domain-containing protein [Candidatus Limnocylindrales bacterium]
MDHPEVRQRMADALAAGLLPSLLEADPATLGDTSHDETTALRAHLADCAACRSEAGALVTTGALLAVAAPDDVAAPVAARERILRSVREMGMVRPTSIPAEPAAPRRSWFPRWRLAPVLAAAALSVILVGGVLVVADLGRQRDSARADVTALADLTTASGHILARPDHAQISLATASGTPAGMVVFSPSSGQLAVWSHSLNAAQAGARYDCYLERDGRLTVIGWMEQAGDVAYWVGQVPSGVTLGQAGDRFIVQADHPGASPVLSGTF